MSFKRFGEHNVRESNLGFLQGNLRATNMRGTIGGNHHFTDQIFLKSINKSNIGRMSGQNKPIKQIQYEEILPPLEDLIEEEEEVKHRKKRINFSTFKGIATSKIMPSSSNKGIKPTQSRVMLPQTNQNYRPQIQPMQQDFADDSLIIISFQGKDKKDLLHSSGCYICSSTGRVRCKLNMQNESTLQILVQGGKDQESDYNRLLANINFDTIEVDVDYTPKLNNKHLAIVAGQYRLLFQHHKEGKVREEFEKLDAMRKQSKGTEFRLDKLLSIDEFYLRRYETEEFFTKHCQTGDVLLFQDTHFFAKAQRFFTRSDFDHVAVAIKDYHHGLLMFESTSSGVSLTPWRSVIRHGWFQSIPRIAWRRLNTDRDAGFYKIVENFVKENLEKSYNISFAKLTANVSMIHAPPEEMNGIKGEGQKQEEQGFFCSELVAVLYKELGLLTRDTKDKNYQPSSKFYPKDFSNKGERVLDKGELSPEYDIFFDRRLLKLNYKTLKVE